MAKNFSQQFTEHSQSRKPLSPQTILADTGTADLLTSRPAASEGHLLTLRPDQLIPDPDQPRRTFSPDHLTALQHDIEANGQLQPILVREADTPGHYLIIFGECRWRAIAQSSTVTTITAMLHRPDSDEGQVLLIQFAENTQRTDITALERGQALLRLTTLLKPQGKTQKQIAEMVHLTQARLSKYIQLAKAPEEIQAVSSEDGLQDLDLLHTLRKLYEDHPQATTALLARWRQHPERTPLRQRVDRLLDTMHPSSPRPVGPGPDTGHRTRAGHAPPSSPAPAIPLATHVAVAPGSDLQPEPVLTVRAGDATLTVRLSRDHLVNLHDLLQKALP